jgi:hypothetical protein
MTPQEGPRDSRPYPDPEHSLAPRKPRTVGGAVYLVVLAATGAGLVLVALDRWRLGLGVIGVARLGAALARLVIPQANAGMLGMRPKVVDVPALVMLGTGLVVLARVIPNQPPL